MSKTQQQQSRRLACIRCSELVMHTLVWAGELRWDSALHECLPRQAMDPLRTMSTSHFPQRAKPPCPCRGACAL